MTKLQEILHSQRGQRHSLRSKCNTPQYICPRKKKQVVTAFRSIVYMLLRYEGTYSVSCAKHGQTHFKYSHFQYFHLN